ncbi:MAG TPA: ABC transporter ATP-binding protein/permease [Candidatus Onthoplasma faecipullorum]|nr:ABC transporter ATP-binding protein/permease [Candidatus Onthoplasma faecipullorum]
MPARSRDFSKPKNFKASIKKLFSSLKPYTFIIIISIILIILSTVCTLIGPNRLSEVTDVIEQGLSVNLDLTNEQYNTLINDKLLTITSEQVEFNLTFEDYSDDITSNDEVTITFTANVGGNDVEISASERLDVIKENGYVNFDNRNIGISYQNDTLSIWLNTEAKVDIEKIFKICITLVILYIVAYFANFFQGFIMATVNQKVSQDMRGAISKKINRIPLKYYDTTSYGDILSRITNDVDTIGQTLNNSISTLIGAGALFIGSLIMMFVTNWIMALSGIVATLIGFILMNVIIKKSQKYFIMQQNVLGQANGYVEEAYSGQEIIKAYNAEDEVQTKFEKINQKLYVSGWKSQFFSGLMQPLMSFIGNFGYVVVCVVGAVLVHYGYINFSVIIAIMIYIRLFTQPLSQLAQGVTNLQSTAAASERVFEFLEVEELSNEDNLNKKVEKVKGNVEFKHVHFGYNPDKIIINDFSASIKSGEKVAIVGPTGAGKTTLVNLLMKFYDINSGDIIIDGVSIKDMKREDVHDLFGMVLQDTWLFNGTIKENIRYNKQDVTDEQIVEACKVAGIDHFIRTLPNGYDTILDDNTNISAGQKQLLTIARAMVENAPMLILDEATSSVDTRTEILIQQAMDKLTENRTSFVIAHRLSTIKNADLILVLKDGDIVEQGNHEELLKKGGFYADLYNSQFEEV